MVNQELDNQLLQAVKELIEKCIPMSDIDYEAFIADWISKVDGQIDPFMSKFYDEMVKIIDICRKDKKETPAAGTARESK
ncbi:hypothetical protein K413DRAFT_0831 [Clostridium sp. ASBs410]|nr:hypothetical protein K413DRAFT_0831 [Clostridium sp. ASBs410]